MELKMASTAASALVRTRPVRSTDPLNEVLFDQREILESTGVRSMRTANGVRKLGQW